MNEEKEFGIKYRLDFVNDQLRGKTIKRLLEATSKRVFIEFEDGSQGMIEVLRDEKSENRYLAVMPPNDLSEGKRALEEIFGENVEAHGARTSDED